MESFSHSSLALGWLILAFVVPLAAIFFAYKMKTDKLSTQSLLILVGLQFCLSGAGYLTMETGEVEEEKVEGIVEKKLIQAHESSSEIAVGFASLATLLSVVVIFSAPALRARMMIAIGILGLTSAGLSLRVRHQGESLVSSRRSEPLYDKKSNARLETIPGNFSDTPVVNESLKLDENDYEGAEDEAQPEDDFRQED